MSDQGTLDRGRDHTDQKPAQDKGDHSWSPKTTPADWARQRDLLSERDRRRLAKFEKGHGHPPRILHIGNIANNAFNNAKVLNRLGFDCDVLCYDYYHIMGCPEWEDARFDATGLDQDRPDWRKVDLGGYKRPPWFAQGPLRTCLAYLDARRSERTRRAEELWCELCEAARLVDARRRRFRFVRTWAANILRILRTVLLDADAPRRAQAKVERNLASAGVSDRFRPFPLWMVWICVWLPNVAFRRVYHLVSRDPFDERVTRLTRRFSELFPQRLDHLDPDDCLVYRFDNRVWKRLLRHYDLVVGYATDAIHPMLANWRPYVAFEHGTIRDIPFESTPIGRLTSLAYAEANVVFLTNADSVPKAQALQARATVYGLHGLDDDALRMRIESAMAAGPDPRFDFGSRVRVFFAPARQHWRSGFATWRKGNNLVIEAAAALAREHPGTFRLVLVEWGAEVDLSKTLIQELGVGDHVTWVPPMGKSGLLRAYRSVDCVIDQFVLPCTGSVTLEAIAVGHAPVITALDDNAMARFYGETIPLFNCHDTREILEAMRVVVLDESSARRFAVNSHQWFVRNHSGKVHVERWVECLTKAGVLENLC